ncbi:hypothetical protein Tco_0550949 [Tanacetum coccineum]
MFRSTLKLPLETPNHPFIIPTTLKYIQPFLKIVGYQGIVDKVSAFYMNNLAQPWQKMFKIFHAMINRVHVDYADLLWWDFLHCVQQKKDGKFQQSSITKLYYSYLEKGGGLGGGIGGGAGSYEEEYKDHAKEYVGVDVLMIQPKSVESTQGTIRTPRATMTPNPTDVVQTKLEKHKLAEDMEKLVEGKDEESYASKFADFVFLDDKDTGNRIEPESHKENPEIVDDDDDEEEEEKKDDDKDDVNDDNDNDYYDDQALVRNKKMGSSEDRNEKMQIPIPSPPISPSIDLSSDKNISQELMTIMKSNLQDQVNDPKVWDVLKCKFEKSSASSGPYRTDAFRKRDHDDHQEDDAPPEGEKRVKRQKISKGSKSASDSS